MYADIIGIRGSLFKELKRYVTSRHSAETYRDILKKLKPDFRELFEGVVISNQFYDLRAYQQFLELLSTQVSSAELENSARYLAEENLKGLFLVFSRMLSKEYLIKKMSDMWEKIYTTGSISLIENSDTRSGVLVQGIEFNLAHRIHTEIYIRTILERATSQKHTSESRIAGLAQTEFWFYPAP